MEKQPDTERAENENVVFNFMSLERINYHHDYLFNISVLVITRGRHE